MATNNAPTIPGAVMADKVIAQIQQGLVDGLPWLDVAFGRAQRITRMVEGRQVVTPNVFCGGWNGHGKNDYIEVSPDSHIGNFAFFDLEDPQTLDTSVWSRQVSVPFSVIFWFDLRKIYTNGENRNVAFLEAQVLDLLNGRGGWHLEEGRVALTRIYERVENIYRGYTLSEVDNQFLMHPFAGFRIEGVLAFNEFCFA